MTENITFQQLRWRAVFTTSQETETDVADRRLIDWCEHPLRVIFQHFDYSLVVPILGLFTLTAMRCGGDCDCVVH